jgi:hypothetical protein
MASRPQITSPAQKCRVLLVDDHPIVRQARLPRRLIIYGIEGKSFDLGAEVSSEAKVAASRVVNCIVAELTLRCAGTYRQSAEPSRRKSSTSPQF